MSVSDHAHDDMWRTPTPASTSDDDEQPKSPAPSRVVEEHAVEDSWYQVLRRKHVEEAGEE
jgi:hypothetical protein